MVEAVLRYSNLELLRLVKLKGVNKSITGTRIYLAAYSGKPASR